MSALNKQILDVSRIFLAFLALQGDVKRTALAVGMEEEEILALATQEKWHDKITNFATLREADSKVQIQINRAMGFVQACQLGTIVDALIKEFSEPNRMMELLTTTSKFGSSFSTKAVTDLVRAAEAIQRMKACALGDHQTPAEEVKLSGASIGLNVARALSAVQENKGLDAMEIVQKQLPDSIFPTAASLIPVAATLIPVAASLIPTVATLIPTVATVAATLIPVAATLMCSVK